MRKIDLTGRVFGDLTVISEVGKTKFGNYVWHCVCSCGNEVDVISGNLIKNHTLSCGCRRKQVMAEIGKMSTHNQSRPSDANYRLYVVWHSMRNRCDRPSSRNYKYYGGRGITYCDEWKNYEAFQEWALKNGYDKDAKYGQCTIDRIDVNGNYEPSNCRWVDAKTQANNRRINLQKCSS